jgi:hypothetical protein
LNVRIGSINPEIKENTTIDLPNGDRVTLEPVIRTKRRIGLKDFDPCTIFAKWSASAIINSKAFLRISLRTRGAVFDQVLKALCAAVTAASQWASPAVATSAITFPVLGSVTGMVPSPFTHAPSI